LFNIITLMFVDNDTGRRTPFIKLQSSIGNFGQNCSTTLDVGSSPIYNGANSVVEKNSTPDCERNPPCPIELRFHHIISLYYALCLSLEEKARTPMFNHVNVLGELFALRMQKFYKNILDLADEEQIKIVGSLDDICKECTIIDARCYLEDEPSDYAEPVILGIKIGDVITIGDLKRKLQQFYVVHDAYWKEENWRKKLEKHPNLAKYTKENFWLYQRKNEDS